MKFTLSVKLLERLLQNPKFSFYACRKMSQLPKVFVRHLDEEQTMKINFIYGSSEFPDRNFCFLRPKDEKVETALLRMRSKIQNFIAQKNSRKKKKLLKDEGVELPPVDILLVRDGVRIDESKKNNEVWTSGTQMKINDYVYEISENPPAVSHLSLPKHIMAGFPVYPKITLEFCTKDESIFKWYKLIKRDEYSQNKSTDIVKIKNENWLKLSNSFFYITKENDIDSKLKITCIPKCREKIGMEESAVSTTSVQPGPGRCPFEDR
ncbi:2',5'-phosphodiesterase 12, partial [Stegodyphus mimosarum]